MDSNGRYEIEELDSIYSKIILKKQLEQEIDFLKGEIMKQRATGRSSRLLNEYIEKFFKLPINTEIPIYDHYGFNLEEGADFNVEDDNSVRMSRQELCERIKRRLYNEYRDVKYELKNFILVRKSLTQNEEMYKRIDFLENKIKELGITGYE